MDQIPIPQTPTSMVTTNPNLDSGFRNNSLPEQWIMTCDQHIKQKRSKNPKTIPNLMISFDIEHGVPYGHELTEQGLKDLKQILANILGLYYFETDLPNDPLISHLAFKDIVQSLYQHKSLKSLSIKINNLVSIDQSNCFKELGEFLSTTIQLEELRLYFDQSSKFDQIFENREIGKQLSPGFSHLTHSLLLLNLNFEQCQGDINHVVAPLATSIVRMKYLERLILNFANSTLGPEGLDAFIADKIHLPKLQFVSICLANCLNLTTKSLKKFSKLFSHLNLQDLTLDYSFLDAVDNDVIISLRKSLSTHRKIHTLSFSFMGCSSIALMGFYNLRDLIVNFGELTKARINLSYTEILEGGVAAVCGGIAVCEKVRDIAIDISRCFSIQGATTPIIRDLLNYRKELTHFTLVMNKWYNRMDLESLDYLKVGLSKAKLIKSLNMSFDSCSQIEDNSMLIFRDIINDMYHLNELCLNFSDCNELTKTGVSYLRDALVKVSKFKKLVLSFNNCDKLQENVLNYAKEVLDRNRSISMFQFDLFRVKELYDNGLIALRDGIIKCKGLKTVQLTYTDDYAAMYKIDQMRIVLTKYLPETQIIVKDKP